MASWVEHSPAMCRRITMYTVSSPSSVSGRWRKHFRWLSPTATSAARTLPRGTRVRCSA